MRMHRVAVIGLSVIGLLAGGAWLLGVPGPTEWIAADSPLRDPERLIAWLDRAGPLGIALFVGLMAVSVVLGPIPTLPFALVSGAVYGPLAGSLVAMTGGLLGALAAFTIARATGGAVMALRARSEPPDWSGLSGGPALFWLVVAARLAPVMSFALVSYAAGLTRLSARAFTLATALGMAPMTIAAVLAGSASTALLITQ